VASYRDVLRYFTHLGAAILAIAGFLPAGAGMPKPSSLLGALGQWPPSPI
jgi:hypothetical protein